MTDGQRIRLKGKGAPGERGGPNGDLYVTVHVRPHPVFGRRGDNLTVTCPGDLPRGRARRRGQGADPRRGAGHAEDPAGTANGRTIRVRGRGAARKDGTRGDLLVTIEVAVPQNCQRRGRKALEAYAAATAGDDPRADLMAAARHAERGPHDAENTSGSTSSRSPPSSPACTRRPCASTTGSAWSPPTGRRGAGAATPPATSPSCARSRGCPRRRASTSPGSSASSSSRTPNDLLGGSPRSSRNSPTRGRASEKRPSPRRRSTAG